MTQTSSKEQRISQRAYEIWQKEGCPQGQDLKHWLAAEREINGKVAPAGATAAGPQNVRVSVPGRAAAQPVQANVVKKVVQAAPGKKPASKPGQGPTAGVRG